MFQQCHFYLSSKYLLVNIENIKRYNTFITSVDNKYKLNAKKNRLSDLDALKERSGASDGSFYVV